MGAAPLFKRNETVYLATSASIGQLEGYQVTTVKQSVPGQWLYRVDFTPKPPEGATVGDAIDMRIRFRPVYYTESELLPLCDALQQVVGNLTRRFKSNEAIKTACVDSSPALEPGQPRFNIDDRVWFRASAKLGFIETSKVTAIQSISTSTSSNRSRFVYELAVKSKAKQGTTLVWFEDELIAQCEALSLVSVSLTGQLNIMQQKLAEHCPGR